MDNRVNIICLKTEAFEALIDRVVAYIDSKHQQVEKLQWIDGAEAMKLLGITAPNTLQKLRDTGAIKFSSISRKQILYSRESVLSFIESKTHKPL